MISYFTLLFASTLLATESTGIDKDLVRTAIQNNMKAIKACYEENIVNNKKVVEKNGKVVVQFTINNDGKVKEFGSNEKTTLNDKYLLSCMQVVFSKIQFPKAPEGQEATITYPFVFNTNPPETTKKK